MCSSRPFSPPKTRAEVWPLLLLYINEKQKMFLSFGEETYGMVIDGFRDDNVKLLSRSEKALATEKDVLKGQRRKLTLCLRRATPATAIEKSTWFHLSNNMAMSMTYNLRRINEVCKEHVDNNFRPLPDRFKSYLTEMRDRVTALFAESRSAIDDNNPEMIDDLRRRCDLLKQDITVHTRKVYDFLQNGETDNMTVTYVYLNVLQESQELVTSLRKMLRAAGKLNLEPAHYRSFSQVSRKG